MTSYLQAGWYESGDRTRLRPEVLDGAMDAAGALRRAGVPVASVTRLALKVRSLVVVADPLMRGTDRFGKNEREALALAMEAVTQPYPALHGFVVDCLGHVDAASDLTALYLHLIHITRMMYLLDHATGAADRPSRRERRRPKTGRAQVSRASSRAKRRTRLTKPKTRAKH